jgi:hypothetical protein
LDGAVHPKILMFPNNQEVPVWTHIPDNWLAAFDAGMLSRLGFDAVIGHLSQCVACRDRAFARSEQSMKDAANILGPALTAAASVASVSIAGAMATELIPNYREIATYIMSRVEKVSEFDALCPDNVGLDFLEKKDHVQSCKGCQEKIRQIIIAVNAQSALSSSAKKCALRINAFLTPYLVETSKLPDNPEVDKAHGKFEPTAFAM